MSLGHEDDQSTPAISPGRRLLAWLFGAPEGEPSVLPKRIGRYRVIEQIGEGGMGRVLLASDDTLRRKVALKTMKRTDKSSRRRFLREARAAARVSHPNVCPIFEVGEEGRRPFLAMELLPGETLAARLRRGPLPLTEAMDLAQDLLAALGALHDAGIVHRDVKPSNLFLTPHGGKLLDFGLARELPGDVARALATATDLTRPGLIIGTPGYMAPEQILGQPVDPRADLFAAGAILFEALTGQRPFQGENVVQALSGTLYDEAPLPRKRRRARGAGRADPPGPGQEARRAPRVGPARWRARCGRRREWPRPAHPGRRARRSSGGRPSSLGSRSGSRRPPRARAASSS